MPKRVAILISGSGSNMMTLVDAMEDAEFGAEPVLVLSNNPYAGGLAKAAAKGIPALAVDHRQFGKDRRAFEAELSTVLEAHSPDIICLAGFMRILDPEFIRRWEGKMINIHPSLLPKYKGLHTHQRALDAGDTESGCSVHVVTADLDAGPILGQAVVPILPDDTADTLAERILVEEHKLYPAMLKRFVDEQ